MKRRATMTSLKKWVFAVKRDEWMMDASVECCVVMKICAVMLVIGLCSEIGCTDRFQWEGVDATDGGRRKGGRARRLVI
jgi:hypothetical protein